ncbi:OmpA family protein [Aliikangiella sp. IMCC44653]
MKKVITITALLVASTINTANAAASSTEENIGFATGAITGAAVGGPLGFILGGVAGILLGDQVEKANQLEQVNQEYVVLQQQQSDLQLELSTLRESIANAPQETSGWLADGPTLNLMFTTNSFALSDTDLANIKRIAKLLNNYPNFQVQLDGYSDPRGSKASNLTLSQQRVSAVEQAFAEFGIDSNRIISHAHGEISTFEQADRDALAMARKVSLNFIDTNANQVAQN